jgi:hypothetical protein
MTVPPMTVSAILSDGWDVYRLLLRRSIPIALGVYAVINGVDLVNDAVDNLAARITLDILSFVLSFAGPILVQGALVKIVRDVHEGVRPETTIGLLRSAWRRLASLVGASIVYSLGLVIGLVLLIVPGLLAAARWALMAPAIMLEGRETMPAQARSRAIVVGEIENGLGDRTRLALGVVVTSFLLTAGLPSVITFLVYRHVWDWAAWVFGVLVSALLAPYQAHVLSVLYYRLVDPQRPAVDPQVWTWPSVWRGVPETA